jgi:hypothetical protein
MGINPMKLAFLYLDRPDTINTASDYLEHFNNHHTFYIELGREVNFSISITHRTSFQETITQDTIIYNFVRDEFDSVLRWWQEPASSFELLANIKADIIQIAGLNLPLNYRWLRRIIGDKTKIIGCHTGEDIWAQRNLWLQQFGLRVVDGFIFKKKSDAESWIRNAVILPKQSLFILNAYGTEDQNEIEKLRQIYLKIQE